MALGAAPRDAMALVIKRVAFVLAGALALSGALYPALMRVLSSQVEGLRTPDPVTVLVVACLVVGAAVFGTLLVTRRVLRLQPAALLR
jgi:hypothetical protein